MYDDEAHVCFSFGFEVWTPKAASKRPGRGVPQERKWWSLSHSAAPYRGRRVEKRPGRSGEDRSIT